MFWIGMIVGIVFAIAVILGVMAWAMYITGTTIEEFNRVVDANQAAFMNRESKVQVWHEDEVIFETTLEAK